MTTARAFLVAVALVTLVLFFAAGQGPRVKQELGPVTPQTIAPAVEYQP